MSRPLADIVARPPARPAAIESIPIALIDVAPNRLRPVDPGWAAALAEQFKGGARLPPIEVRPGERDRFILVIGGHRLEAHRLAGTAEIAATVSDIGELEARLRETDENLFRHELTILDRALSLAERDRVLPELHPEAQRGGDRKSLAQREKIKAQSLRFDLSDEIAGKVGLSKRSVQQAVSLAKALSPEAVALVRGTYLADHGSDLAALARLRPDQQLFAAREIAEGRAAKLKDALAALGRGPAPSDEQERLFQQIVAAWSRATAKTRRRILDHIGPELGSGPASPGEDGATNGSNHGEAARQERAEAQDAAG